MAMLVITRPGIPDAQVVCPPSRRRHTSPNLRPHQAVQAQRLGGAHRDDHGWSYMYVPFQRLLLLLLLMD